MSLILSNVHQFCIKLNLSFLGDEPGVNSIVGVDVRGETSPRAGRLGAGARNDLDRDNLRIKQRKKYSEKIQIQIHENIYIWRIKIYSWEHTQCMGNSMVTCET